MAYSLRNNLHEVITTISILNTNTGEVKYNTKITKVYFKNWNQKNIKYYINNFDIKDKAGAYAIQDGANSPVEKINGCTLNVIGLPICNLIELLLKFKEIRIKANRCFASGPGRRETSICGRAVVPRRVT